MLGEMRNNELELVLGRWSLPLPTSVDLAAGSL